MIFTLLESCKTKAYLKTLTLVTSVLVLGILWLSNQLASTFMMGALLGLVLSLVSFHFAKDWILFWQTRNSKGVRTTLLLLAAGSLIFFPMITLLPQSGIEASGAIRALSLNVALGAFLFGIGMALSQTGTLQLLKHTGLWHSQYLIVFSSMVIGATLAATNMDFWVATASIGTLSLAIDINWETGLVINICFIGLLYYLALVYETKSWALKDFMRSHKMETQQFIQFVFAAFAIALLNLLILIETSQMWNISLIFTKIGTEFLQLLSAYNSSDFATYNQLHGQTLQTNIINDNIVLVSFGFVVGTALFKFTLDSISTNIEKTAQTSYKFTAKKGFILALAGLLMGYGATISFGCDMGAFFNAVTSGSLHGWLWFACAFIGVGLTVKLIPSST